MSGHRVAEGTQVNHEGTVYAAGEDLPELDEGLAREWQRVGWIVPAPEEKPKRSSRPKTG